MFKKLVIFEMANNHQGLNKHGLKIIKKYSSLGNEFNLNHAIKLQYRNLDTFISKKELKLKQNKHVTRFISTSLKRQIFNNFCKEIKLNNAKLIITPFDEISVDHANEDGVDIVKIASCSANDWPLIEKIASIKKPVIFSTGGQNIDEIDNLYSFFSHKKIDFAIMHCVSMYPTEYSDAQINFIKKLKNRYKNIVIGYSGHESPNDTSTVQVAAGAGAQIFERHVGIPTSKIKLNSYSMNVNQTRKWLISLNNSFKILGNNQNIKNIKPLEKQSIMELQRGVFLNKKITKGKKIKLNDVYFAFPLEKNQVSSGDFYENIRASQNYQSNSPLKENIKILESKKIRKYIHDFKGMFAESNVVVGDYESIELSHHYGLKNFAKIGCILITVINKSYCKKLVGVLPNQKHPSHRHFKKNESFHILSGKLVFELNNIKYKLKEGDVIHVEKGSWHSFESEEGCIFEEVSSKYFVGDSEYIDKKITMIDPYERKTKIEQW